MLGPCIVRLCRTGGPPAVSWDTTHRPVDSVMVPKIIESLLSKVFLKGEGGIYRTCVDTLALCHMPESPRLGGLADTFFARNFGVFFFLFFVVLDPVTRHDHPVQYPIFVLSVYRCDKTSMRTRPAEVFRFFQNRRGAVVLI